MACLNEEDLNRISDEELLKMRVCDLPLSLSGTWLEGCVARLHEELKAKGLTFFPECYLADEWMTPVGEPVIGIPFYLAHPRLIQLERTMMLEAEGEGESWCMQLLRHEAGHALCYAYGLNRRRSWRRMFGSPHEEYGETYRIRPYSKNYVRHLDGFYAQFHPDEDFVETFAVWLTPGSRWREVYRGWKALHKLEYVDALMKEIAGRAPLKATGRKRWHQKSLRYRLATYYKRKQKIHREDFPQFHDPALLRIFRSPSEPTKSGSQKAARWLKTQRKFLVREIAAWTGERRYVVNDVLGQIIQRCEQMNLVRREDGSDDLTATAVYATTLIVNALHTGWMMPHRKHRRRG